MILGPTFQLPRLLYNEYEFKFMNLHIRSLEEMTNLFDSNEFRVFISRFPESKDQATVIGEDGFGAYKQPIYKLPDDWHVLCKVTAFYHNTLVQLRDKYKEKNVQNVKRDVLDLINDG